MAKILIYTTASGGGHIAATRALIGYLSPFHDIEVVSIYVDVLKSVDPVRFMTFGKADVETFYNFFLQHKTNWFINCFCTLGFYLFPWAKGVMRKKIYKHLKITSPDVVISVVPLMNGSIEFSCDKLGIPFILIPTDLNATFFLRGFEKEKQHNFAIGIAFDDKKIKEIIKNYLPDFSNIHIAGFPVDKSFFESKDIAAIHHDFVIPFAKPILIVLMGAVGSPALYKYLKHIAKYEYPLHILVCLGKAEHLRQKIEEIEMPNHITKTIISFTDRISDLMKISDLCLTKSGTVSICEAMYTELPILIDATATPLLWEKFNLDFIHRHNFGEPVFKYEDIGEVLEKFLQNKEYYQSIKKSLESYRKELFGKHIQALVEHALHKK